MARQPHPQIDPFDVGLLRGLLERATDQRERARLRGLLQFASPEARKAHGALTRKRMAAPAVRQRIREGVERAAARELIVLREARRNAPPEVRERFLAEIACVAPMNGPGNG